MGVDIQLMVCRMQLWRLNETLVNDWKFGEIVTAFGMNENQLINVLLRLDRLKIIDYRAPHGDTQARGKKLFLAQRRPDAQILTRALRTRAFSIWI